MRLTRPILRYTSVMMRYILQRALKRDFHTIGSRSTDLLGLAGTT